VLGGRKHAKEGGCRLLEKKGISWEENLGKDCAPKFHIKIRTKISKGRLGKRRGKCATQMIQSGTYVIGGRVLITFKR